MTQPQLKVVIVGGGIGGLFAANALIARGFDVAVPRRKDREQATVGGTRQFFGARRRKVSVTLHWSTRH